jgi:anaerobic ribonucleoside-triphosphate reductase activating protein
MLIARLLYPVTVLGPGQRIVLWTAGCSKRCPCCASPELWDAKKENDVRVTDLLNILRRILKTRPADGLTLTGGDPLEQADELRELLEGVRPLCGDILVYTGYDRRELKTAVPPQALDGVLRNTSVLIDGRYIHALNDNKSALIGSRNQTIWFLDETVRETYTRYCNETGRQIQNVYRDGKLLSIGIHNREFRTGNKEIPHAGGT